jgi:serine/threonine protein kinase
MEIRAGVNLGRYQLLAEIGRGAAGTVYQALDPDIDRLVAIKIFSGFDATSDESEAFRELFAQEARAAGRLMHPSIVAVYDRGEEPETQTPYIVMEYVAGQPLSKLLGGSSSRIQERFALQIAKEIAEALAFAHDKGVVHRDIKPSNILITDEGNAKIADFGVARLDSSNAGIQGEILGTPAYMSPEQMMGGPLDGRTDIFSLGVILYTMLSGFRPFQGNGASTICFKVLNQEPVSITNLHLDLSKDAEYVVARAMAKDPEQRYVTGTVMAQDLGDILDGKSPRSREEVKHSVSADVVRVDRDYRPFLTAVGHTVTRATLSPSYDGHSVAPSVDRTPSTTTVIPQRPEQVSNSRFGRLAASPIVILGVVVGIASAAGAFVEHFQRTTLQSADTSIGMPAVFLASMTPPPISVTSTAPDEPEVIVWHREPKLKKTTRTRAIDSDLDYTATHSSRSEATAVPVNVSAILSATPAPMRAPIEAATTGKATSVQLALQHNFAQAEVSVWVDDQLAFSGIAHGAAKKRFFVLRGNIEGKELHELRLLSGAHEIKVRVHTADNQYDSSGSVRGNFVENQHAVLEIRCNKHGIELKLTSGS